MTPDLDLGALGPDRAPSALTELALRSRPGRTVAATVPDRAGWWDDGTLVDDLFEGAGFGAPRRTGPSLLRATRRRSLPDTVGPGMRMLVVGLNPSLHAADAGVGFVSPSNRFWPAAQGAGLVDRDRDPSAALARGIGMTDLVKRATRRADELAPAEYRSGLARLERLGSRLGPGVVCFVGLAGWRAAVDRRAGPGPATVTVGGCPAYVMPSTSGLNAHARLEDLVAHLAAAVCLAEAD